MRLSAIPGRDAAVLALAALAAVVLFGGAAGNEIHGTSVFYAALAREIADSGDWLGVFSDERAYLLKPPLNVWLVALAVKLLGPTSVAASLSTRLAGAVLVWLTWRLGVLVGGRATGWWAALVLVTNATFITFTTSVRMDPLLTCGLTLAAIGLLRPAAARAPLTFWGGVALAVMAKGPLGLAPLALAPLAVPLGLGRAGLRRWLVAAWPLLVPLAWYGYLWSLHGGAVFGELQGDALRAAAGYEGGRLRSAVDHYLRIPAERWWPWLPFMAWGVAAAAASLRRQAGGPWRPQATLLLAWVAMTWLGATLKPDHDPRYLYPALPALAVLAATVLARLSRHAVPRLAAPVLVVAALGGCAYLGARADDPRPAIARMQALLAERPDPGAPVVVLGTQIPVPDGPRRQSAHRDWVYYYLGLPVTVWPLAQADPVRLRGLDYVMVASTPHRDAVLARLGLEPLAEATHIVLARPRQGTPR